MKCYDNFQLQENREHTFDFDDDLPTNQTSHFEARKEWNWK